MIGDNPLIVKLFWAACTALLIFTLNNLTILWCFIALFVIFPSTGWYIDTDFGYDYRYNFLLDNELFNFKPNEIFIFLFFFKVCLYKFLRPERISLPKTDLNRGILLLIFAVLFGFFIGIEKNYSIQSIFQASEFRILLEGILFFYITWNCIDRKIYLNQTIHIFVIFSLVKSVIAILEFNGLVPNIFYTKGYSISNYSSIISGVQDLNVIVFSIFFLISFLFRKSKKFTINDLIISLSILFLIFVLIFSFRRTSYAMLLVGLLIFSIRLNFKQIIIGSFILVLFIITTITYTYQSGSQDLEIIKFIKLRFSIANRIDQYDQVVVSNNAHFRDILMGLNFVKDNPILGLGTGSKFFADRSMTYETSFIHNGLLHSWIKFGILGAFSYIFFYYYCIKSCIFRKWHSLTDHWIPLSCFSFIISNIISELFMPPFYQNFQKTSLLFLSLSIVERYWCFEKRKLYIKTII